MTKLEAIVQAGPMSLQELEVENGLHRYYTREGVETCAACLVPWPCPRMRLLLTLTARDSAVAVGQKGISTLTRLIAALVAAAGGRIKLRDDMRAAYDNCSTARRLLMTRSRAENCTIYEVYEVSK